MSWTIMIRLNEVFGLQRVNCDLLHMTQEMAAAIWKFYIIGPIYITVAFRFISLLSKYL